MLSNFSSFTQSFLDKYNSMKESGLGLHTKAKKIEKKHEGHKNKDRNELETKERSQKRVWYQAIVEAFDSTSDRKKN